MKKGTVREDGKMYWCSSKRKGEIWLTPEQYAKWDESVRNYRRKCQQAYYERREKINPSDRSYIGKYNPATNKYFARLSSSGKEIWVTKQELERLKLQSKRNRRNFLKRLQSLPDNKIKVGDVHPTDKNLFVVYKVGKKPMYGTKEQLQLKIKSRARSYKLRNIKYYAKKRQIIEKLGENRLHRGLYDVETGLVFWEYSANCKERWISEEEFHSRRNKQCVRKKVRRLELKMTKNDVRI